jgi:hypothetical protein
LVTLLPFALYGAVAQAVSQSHLILDNVASQVSFGPVMPMNLSAIVSEQSFTALSHPRFPHHSVRIKKSTFCDPTVSSVYVDHLFVLAHGNHEEATHNVHAFLFFFFLTSKQFAGRRFHLSCESYAGRYLPVFASEIYDQNVVAEAEERAVINLRSVLIRNGVTDVST